MPMNAMLLIRLDAELRRAIDTAAADDDRTSSAYARKLIVDHLREKGYLKDSPARKSKPKGTK